MRGLGLGSARLLIAGLQRKAAATASIILVDELEHGLEPHRIVRFLGALGAKDQEPPLQAFVTTHSPVALRELSGAQLFVMGRENAAQQARNVGTDNDIQSTIRLYPDAFLASSVIVGEGASEVGLLRGLDQFRVADGNVSIAALGVALVDAGGGEADRPFARARALLRLGYRTAVLRDDDKKPTAGIEEGFEGDGGRVFRWRDGRALEDELFLSLSDAAVGNLIDYAAELHSEDLIDAHIKSASQGRNSLEAIRSELVRGRLTRDSGEILARAAQTRRQGWFKSVTWMEHVGLEIVAPDLARADAGFRAIIESVFVWAGGAGG